MIKIKSISLIRAVALALAIYVFNASIDSQDAHPDYVAEDLSYNDIESVYEFLMENVFDVENAVEEYDEHDSDHGGIFDFDEFYFEQKGICLADKGTPYLRDLNYNTFFLNKIVTCWAKINDPPPWA